MKIAAVTAEFDPLHNGHLHLLSEIRENIRPDILLVILGGDFTQRGKLAFFDKYTRAKHAVTAGADLVIEMPQIFASSCAERFADAAVKLLAALDADEKYICFGSESGDLTAIENAARILNEEPESMSDEIRALLDMGCSYPVARAQAFLHYAEEHDIVIADPTLPNNILAIEYVRSALRRGGITPFTVRRKGNYHDDTIDPSAPSASAIRHAVENGSTAEIYGKALPAFVLDDVKAVGSDHLSPLLLYRLLTMSPEGLKRINDVSEGIENRILRLAKEAKNADDLVRNVSSKRYTEARISRILACALLGITKQLFENEIHADPYYKVLAVKRARTDILSLLSHSGKVLTGETEAKESGIPSAEIDAKAHEIYAIVKESPNIESGMLLL